MRKSISLVSTKEIKVAYPTMVFTVLAVAIYAISTLVAVKGLLNVGWVIGINTLMAYALFTSMHEAGHANISGPNKSLRWVDEVIGWISGIPLLAPFYIFKVIHFRHHAFTNDPEKDPDHWLASRNIFSLIFHSTSIFPVYMIKGMQMLLFDKSINKIIKRELTIGFIGLIGLILLIVLAGSLIGWKMMLLTWIIPAFIAQAFLAFAFDWLPHHPHEEKARYLNTRVIDVPFLSLILLYQNYHLVHHLYPRIPFYDYYKIYMRIEDTVKEKGVEIIPAGK